MYVLRIILLLLKIVSICSQKCEFIRNVVIVHRNSGISKWDSTSVTGCITDESFNKKAVKEVNITCDSSAIPILERNFMSNMNSLTQVLIDSCRIDSIEPGAFSNLPRLESLKLEGNPLKIFPKGVFYNVPNLRKLYIYYNKISFIEDEAFVNLPSLEQVSLEANKLDNLRKEWFSNTTNIYEFLADGNLIQEIPPDMFHGWKNLSEINLNSNLIFSIEEGTFRDAAQHITYLALHHNRLTSISSNIFSKKAYIENLVISGNLFNYIPRDFLENILVESLYIFGNPFTCPCLKRVQQILLERDVVIDDPTDTEYVQPCKDTTVPICVVSQDAPKMCVEKFDRNVTKQFISSLKKNGYDSAMTEANYQCAVFDL